MSSSIFSSVFTVVWSNQCRKNTKQWPKSITLIKSLWKVLLLHVHCLLGHFWKIYAMFLVIFENVFFFLYPSTSSSPGNSFWNNWAIQWFKLMIVKKKKIAFKHFEQFCIMFSKTRYRRKWPIAQKSAQWSNVDSFSK